MGVLVGFAEALSAPECVWSLLDAGFEVSAIGRRGRRSALRHSRLVTVHEITAPENDTAATRRELQELLPNLFRAGGTPHVVLPLDDASLWLGARMSWPAGWTFAGPDGERTSLALDKSKQIEVARAAGFFVPESSVFSKREELEQISLALPVILRPVHAVTEVGLRLTKGANWICADRTEVDRVAKNWRDGGPLLAQPYLTGVGEGIFGLATPHGVVGWSAHRRLRMMNPHGSGSSACISQPVREDVRQPAERFVRATGWRGLFMIELLRASDGRCSFVEFNGRAWGSMALARGRGFEYPAWAAKLALDSDFSPEIPDVQRGEMEFRNVGRELMHLVFVLRGPKSRAARPWPSFWKTLGDFFRGLRASAFYNWRADDQKVFWADALNTIREQLIKRKS